MRPTTTPGAPGSFFTNPIVSSAAFARLTARAGLAGAGQPPSYPAEGGVKTSAAWLIERAGFGKGFGLPGPAALSTKHTLALTNRGGASAGDLLVLAGRSATASPTGSASTSSPSPAWSASPSDPPLHDRSQAGTGRVGRPDRTVDVGEPGVDVGETPVRRPGRAADRVAGELGQLARR